MIEMKGNNDKIILIDLFETKEQILNLIISYE